MLTAYKQISWIKVSYFDNKWMHFPFRGKQQIYVMFSKMEKVHPAF